MQTFVAVITTADDVHSEAAIQTLLESGFRQHGTARHFHVDVAEFTATYAGSGGLAECVRALDEALRSSVPLSQAKANDARTARRKAKKAARKR